MPGVAPKHGRARQPDSQADFRNGLLRRNYLIFLKEEKKKKKPREFCLYFQEHFAPLHCWRPRIELPHFKAAGFRRLGETCPNEATPKTGSATPPQHRRAFGSRPFPLPTLTPTSCAVT